MRHISLKIMELSHAIISSASNFLTGRTGIFRYNLTTISFAFFLFLLLLLRSGLISVPNNAKVHYNYANLQKDVGNLKQAEMHYRTAIRYVLRIMKSDAVVVRFHVVTGSLVHN